MPYAAADGVGEFLCDHRLLKWQLRPLHTLFFLQLMEQGGSIHPDPHGGELQPDIENRVVDEEIAVQGPIVIVR